MVAVTAGVARINLGDRTVDAVSPASLSGVAVGASVLVRCGNVPVVEAVLKPGDGRVSGVSGAWSWWYRDLGMLVEGHFEYAASLAADAYATLAATTTGMPAELYPSSGIPLAAVAPSGTYPVAARINSSGSVTIRNVYTSSVSLIVAHGIWSKGA